MKCLIAAAVTVFGALALSAATVEETLTYAGVKFRVVRTPPERVNVIWKNPQGVPYRGFAAAQVTYAKQGKALSFLMNAGIFEPGGIPSGLHIEGGRQIRPLNLADAPGNFFLKPNGVISFTSGKVVIFTSEKWKAQTIGNESWAIQGGPMLLIDGKRHPAFRENSSSKLHRNGVGVDSKNRIVFVITDRSEEVNFWDFAGLFLRLDCQDALFLDGDISQMAVNPEQPVPSNLFGAMFIIAE